VASASAAFEAAREALREAVRMALDHGASWSDIGATLGVSRQAAFDRFGPKHGPP
jgi:L-alanine-DL-glutamate epimerase-like enolase superfamily enzyme